MNIRSQIQGLLVSRGRECFRGVGIEIARRRVSHCGESQLKASRVRVKTNKRLATKVPVRLVGYD